MRMLDLFTGIGGFHISAKDVWGDELETITFCENDYFKRFILESIYPEIHIYPDIKDLPVYENINLLTAGFPCQDASVARKERQGLNGKETGLFCYLAKYIESSKPDWFVLENVPGLFSVNNGKDFLTIIDTLQKFGYCVCWRVFDARYFGVAQRRRRVFIVGSYRNIGAVKVLFKRESNKWNIKASQRKQSNGVCNTITTREGLHYNGANETLVTGTLCRNKKGNEQFAGNLITGTLTKHERGIERYATGNFITSTIRASSGIPTKIYGNFIAETNRNGNRKINGIPGRILNKIRSVYGDAVVPEVARQIFRNIKEEMKMLEI